MTRTHPRRVVYLLVAATLLPIAALGWLGSRILAQDREVERQRSKDALEVAARRLAFDLDTWLDGIESTLSKDDGLLFTSAGIESTTARPVLYQPLPGKMQDPPAAAFAAVDDEQYRQDNADGAAKLLRGLTGSPDPSIRAHALLRLGAIARQAGDVTAAHRAYDALLKLGDVRVPDHPAAIVARFARGRLLEAAGDRNVLRTAADDLAREIGTGRWRIDRATFEEYEEAVLKWGGPPAPTDAVVTTHTANALWVDWRAGALPSHGRQLLRGPSGSAVVVWRQSPEALVARVVPGAEVATEMAGLASTHGLVASAHDVDGHLVIGPNQTDAVALPASDTQLPFSLRTGLLDPSADAGLASRRRLLLAGGIAASCLLMMAAAYGLYRATTRELEVARQQTDFVAAVSHELRTPLTSMRHLIDLLANRGATPEERRTHYYALLGAETERLHRIVESLLSFGRIEAGGYPWRLEPLDLRAALPPIIDAFRGDSHLAGRTVTLELEESLPEVVADREAIVHALWNLVDNAAKYSAAPIEIAARRDGVGVVISVEDHGIGIAREDTRRIFQKFVRGQAAQTAGIRGVGIGLALVQSIAEVHGGSVGVESEVGRGSTFTLRLPATRS